MSKNYAMNYSRALLRPLLFLMLVLSACGRIGLHSPSSDARTTGPPVALHEPTLTPGCFSSEGRPPSGPLPELTQAEAQLLAAERQMREFRMSYILQEATIIRREVLRDPIALHWSRHDVNERGELLIEGFSTARGEGWGRVHFIASFIPGADFDGPAPADINAEVRYSPQSTRFDFGDHAFEVHNNYVTMELEEGTFKRGCDPRSQTSFEVQPIHSLVTTVIDRTTCWRVDDPVPVFDNERQAEEFTARRRLQCLQLVASLTL